ncbi:hypothetical protein GCM10027422_16420 [Hymenobacter arcticus]
MGLATWLKQVLGAGAQVPAPSALAPAESAGTYLAADQSPCPTAAGAAYRVEVHQQAGLTERRLYNLLDGPAWLEELLETGHDAQGQALHRRTWYLPWGQVSKEIVRCGDHLGYRRYFANGELELSKQATAGRLTERYAYAPAPAPAGHYRYSEQMPEYPDGDMKQVMSDIQRAFVYPARALRNQEAGRLVMGFVVSATGLVTDIKVVESVSASLDEAGRQAVASIGRQRWRPGFQNRRAVAVSFNVPITCAIK